MRKLSSLTLAGSHAEVTRSKTRVRRPSNTASAMYSVYGYSSHHPCGINYRGTLESGYEAKRAMKLNWMRNSCFGKERESVPALKFAAPGGETCHAVESSRFRYCGTKLCEYGKSVSE